MWKNSADAMAIQQRNGELDIDCVLPPDQGITVLPKADYIPAQAEYSTVKFHCTNDSSGVVQDFDGP
jgi:hypothetical protein